MTKADTVHHSDLYNDWFDDARSELLPPPELNMGIQPSYPPKPPRHDSGVITHRTHNAHPSADARQSSGRPGRETVRMGKTMGIQVSIGDNRLLKDRVYATLKNEIIIGNLKTGDQLNILELASMMNISSAPIREALNMLAKDGFVHMAPRRKAVVAGMSRQDWKIIVDMRMLLEPYAARIAARNIPDELIATLRSQLEAVMSNPDDIYAYIESDRAIHAALYEYNCPKMLSETIANLKEHTMRVKYYSDDVHDSQCSGITIQATKEHMDILDALSARDEDEAAKAVHQHLSRYVARVDKRDDHAAGR